MSDTVRYEVRGRTAIISINRPEARNAVNGDVAEGIEGAVDRMEADPDVWTGILASTGSVFCAGADLKVLAAGRDREMFTPRGNFGGFVRLPRTKPMIAAVDGAALAGGFELVLACDMIVASRRASFGLPEVTRGLVAAAGGLVHVPRLLPRPIAMKLLLTGETIDAATAFHYGLVVELVDAGEALDAATALAEKINANPPLAVRETRRITALSADTEAPEVWKESRHSMNELARTEDYREGLRAFAEKRRPEWTGR